MSQKAKMSIITIVLNGKNTIQQVISNTELAQSALNYEHIIIDGGSTDGTVDIIKANTNKLAYWCSEPDGSAAIAQNKGIAQASGDIIGFLNADDWYEPDTLNKVAQVFDSVPEADIVTCCARLVVFDKKMNTYRETKRYNSNALTLTPENIFYGASAFNARFFRREAIERLGDFITLDENQEHFFTNDKEFLLRAYYLGLKNYTINHLGYTYLAHECSFNFSKKPRIRKRIYLEHTMLVDLLQKKFTLDEDEKNFLLEWQQKESVKYFYQCLKEFQFKTALAFLRKFLLKDKIKHTIDLFIFPLKIIMRKCFSYVTSISAK